MGMENIRYPAIKVYWARLKENRPGKWLDTFTGESFDRCPMPTFKPKFTTVEPFWSECV